MYDQQNPTKCRTTDTDVAVFRVGMILVKKCDQKRISEEGFGLLKTDMVLAHIGSRLSGIPLE